MATPYGNTDYNDIGSLETMLTYNQLRSVAQSRSRHKLLKRVRKWHTYINLMTYLPGLNESIK